MFTIKDWEEGFLWVEFREHPYVDIRENKEVKKFDVSTKHYPDYASNFMRDGAFDQRQYCIILLRMIPELSKVGLVRFLKHQCSLMEDPVEWLLKFEELLEIADDYEPVKTFKVRLKWLSKFISEECAELSMMVKEPNNQGYLSDGVNQLTGKYNMESLLEAIEKEDSYEGQIIALKELRENYFREVKDARVEDSFVKLIDKMLDSREEVVNKESKLTPFHGTAIKLADIYVRYFMKEDDPAFLSKGKQAEKARLVCSVFCNKKGEPYNVETIRTNLGKSIRRILREREA